MDKGVSSYLIVSALALLATSCISPLERTLEQTLRDQVKASQRMYRDAAADSPMVHVTRQPTEVELQLTDERRAELDRIGGPAAYDDKQFDLGSNLMGSTTIRAVKISLREAVQMAARNNMDVQIARIQPAIREAEITQAEAAFDAIYFADLDFQKLDTPLPPTSLGLGNFGTVQQDERFLVTGIRKPLTTGGQVTLSTLMERSNRNPSFFVVNTYYNANILMSLTQPLLRGFGEDVNRAQIQLRRNAKESDLEALRTELLSSLTATEAAYWNLVLARYSLLFQQRLLDRTIIERDKIQKRQIIDATPVEYTQANSVVQSVRANVIRAVNQVRRRSDELKRQINSPDFNVADETLLDPVEIPTDLPIKYNLLDAITTALRHRPEIQRALLNINDASIRQRVADNTRLPQLDVSATMQYSGFGTNVGTAQNFATDGDFIDYLLSVQFEMPLGNRAAQALFRQRQLERRQSVHIYQNIADQVVLAVKISLRNVIDAFKLIDAERGSRLAAADNLRALDVRERTGEAQTPDFIDRRLRSLQALTQAETREIQSLTNYQIAITQLYQSMGTLLKRNGIEFSREPVDE